MIAQGLLWYFCLLFSLCVHEAAHASLSNYCGDPSARLLGRMSLNPLAHIDPIGTVVMPLLMIFSGYPFLFGWAKPVPFNPRNLHNLRRDPVLIALAGPTSNLLVGLFALIALRTGIQLGLDPRGVPAMTGLVFVMINLGLAMFNLIPVPPLDGHHVLYYFLPEIGKRAMEQIGPFGIIIAVVAAQPLLGPPMQRLLHVVQLFAGFHT